MKSYLPLLSAALIVLCAGVSLAQAQSSSMSYKEDIGVDLLYQGSHHMSFDGGSQVNLKDDLGFALTYTYRFTQNFELQTGMDFQWLSNEATVQGDGGQSFKSNGSVHMFTPHIDGIYNFLPGHFTPYVSAGLGWSWIDTDIPSSPPYRACWWDPWYGYYCGVFQNTHSTNDFVYELGAGLRWDFDAGFTMRLAYQKRWIDVNQSAGKPGLDQIRLNLAIRY